MAYKKSKETRDKILTVAKKLFATQGFTKTSVRQICKEADINHSLIYYYFENGKYGIGHYLVNEHIRRSLRAISTFYPYKSNYFLFNLLLIRFIFREIKQDPIDLECYIATWDEENIYRPFFVETYSIAKELNLDVDNKMVRTAVLMSDYVWRGLYAAKNKGDIDLSDKEIRDLTDCTRWTNLGLDKAILMAEIEKAEKILAEIPIQNVRLINQ
ncbi:TetR/AcrR family transcriptional regulator [Alkalibacter mobilis]|uniref:TetR/AcrR family transcriptional regulator n=1 Tax=Alkalibacter mobilis TaxID=2787712 RepID=UPI00189D4881|nr:TetR family transcriptional regulator [Alkalibacter mobilis]MBF7096573.1 TetR/AcrR family transcriptional regulator [Alkalibacter mobilis]